LHSVPIAWLGSVQLLFLSQLIVANYLNDDKKMEERTDILIVGGGPAGSLAGIWALKHGLSCCIVDKSAFPRTKLCAGLITQKTAELVKEITGLSDISHLYNLTTGKVRLLFRDEAVVNYEINEPFHLTYRKEYDFELHKLFLANGGRFLQAQVLLKNIDVEQKTMHFADEKIHYKYLIGADGASSLVRKLVAPKYFPNVFSLETEMSFDALPELAKDEVLMYTGVIPQGYGWVFPKHNGFTVGIAGELKNNKEIHAYFDDFLHLIRAKEKPQNVHGAWIPCGKFPTKVCAHDSILLIGDAAGLTDPLKGEGLYFSGYSGKLAIDAIIEHQKTGKKVSQIYGQKLKWVHKVIREGYFVKRLIFNPIVEPRMFRYAKGHHNIIKYYTENVVSRYNYTYRQLFKVIRDYKKLKKSGQLPKVV
jgi:menaquinone-9 beta-reductase